MEWPAFWDGNFPTEIGLQLKLMAIWPGDAKGILAQEYGGEVT